VVSAQEDTSSDIISGNVAIGTAAGIGIAAGIGVINKTTEAYIGSGANVLARANGTGETVNTGGFTFNDDGQAVIGDSVQFTSGNVSGSTFNIAGHGFKDLQAVTYWADADELNALDSGETYYVIRDSDNSFRLASSLANAQNRVAITGISGTAGQKHALQENVDTEQPTDKSFKGAAVDADNDTIAIANHGFENDQEVVYYTSSDAVGDLKNGKRYFVVNATAGSFQLSETKGGPAVDLRAPRDAQADHLIQPLVEQKTPDLLVNPFKNAEGGQGRSLADFETGNRQGVVVVAVSDNDFVTAGAAAGGGIVGVQLAGAVTVHNINTLAHIDRAAHVNADANGANLPNVDADSQSVYVAAARNYDQLTLGLGVSAAVGAAVTAAVSTPVLMGATEAKINGGNGSSPDTFVNATGDVGVTARSHEKIMSIGVGAAGAGGVAVAGSASAVIIDTTTTAQISGAVAVKAGGNVAVLAYGDTETFSTTGAAAIAAGYGAAPAVSVTKIDKVTTAEITNGASVDASARGGSVSNIPTGDFEPGDDAEIALGSKRGVIVHAASSEKLMTVAASIGIGSTAGFAGSIAIDIVDSDTFATIGPNAKINQSSGQPNDAQSVSVTATNVFEHFQLAGSVGGGGFVGLGVAVGVGSIKNDIKAVIGTNAVVDARDRIDVYALSVQNIDALTFSGAASGGGALAGAITVYNYSGNHTSTYAADNTLADDSNAHAEDDAFNLDTTNDGVNNGTNPITFGESITDALIGSVQNEEAPEPVSFDAGDVNFTDDTIRFDQASGLKTGDAVVYTGTGDTVYYAIVDVVDGADPHESVRLAASREEALADGSVLAFSAGAVSDDDTIAILNHGLATGDRVRFQPEAGTTADFGLASGVYEVVRVDKDHIQLRNVGASTPRDLHAVASSLADDRYKLTVVGNIDLDGVIAGSDHGLMRRSIPAFGASSVHDGTAGAYDTIELGADYGLKSGDVVYYGSGGDPAIGGLRSGEAYFAIVDPDHPTRIGLATSYANATADTPVAISLGTVSGSNHRIGLHANEIASMARKDVQANSAARDDVLNADDVLTAQETGGTVAHVESGANLGADDVAVGARDSFTMDAKAGGVGLAGIVGAGVGIVVTTINADVQAYLDPGVTVRGNDPLSGRLSVEADLASHIEVLGLAGGGSGLLALGASVGVVNDSSDVYALLGAVPSGPTPSGNTTVTGFSDVTVRATSSFGVEIAIGAGAVAISGVLGLAAGVGVVSVDLGGDTRAAIGGTAKIGTASQPVGAVAVEATSNREVKPLDDGAPMAIAIAASASLTYAGSFAGGFAYINDTKRTEAAVYGGAEVYASGDIGVTATSVSDIKTNTLGIAVALAPVGFGIGVSIASAKITGATIVQVGNGARLSSRDREVRITAQATQTITASATPGAVAGLAAGAGGSANATINTTVMASVGDGARIDAASGVFVDAIGVKRDARTNNLTFAGAIGVGVGIAMTKSEVEGTTQALIGDNAIINVATGGLQVSTSAQDYARAESQAVSGGIISGRGSVAEATVKPINEASIGSGVAIDVGGILNVKAAEIAEADAIAKGYGGGGVSVGVSQADAKLIGPSGDAQSVLAAIGSGTTVIAGDVVVEATFGKTSAYDDNIVTGDVNIDDDTFTIPDHGMSTGFVVLYDPNGNAALTMGTSQRTLIDGGIDVDGDGTTTNPDPDQRKYAIIRVSDDTFQLGNETTSDLIDAVKDVIVFKTDHTFQDGDLVHYAVGTGSAVGGLVENTKTYIVQVVDSRTIKLLDPAKLGQTKSFAPDGNVTTGGVFHVDDHGFETGDAVTYYAPGEEEQITGVDLDPGTGDESTGAETLYIDQHGFTVGDTVVYHAPKALTIDGSSIDTATNEIYSRGHGFSDGDTVTLTITNGSLTYTDYREKQLGGTGVHTLGPGTYTFKVLVGDADTLQLTSVSIPYANAPTAGFVLQPSTGFTATLSRASDVPLKIDASASGTIQSIDEANRTITFTGGHGFVTGDRVHYVFTADDNVDNDQPLGGLNSGDYFVAVINNTTIQLATSEDAAWRLANAATAGSATAVAITGNASHQLPAGTHVIETVGNRALKDGRAYVVTSVEGNYVKLGTIARDTTSTAATIHLSASGVTGKHTLASLSESAISGLVDGQTYYVVKQDSDHFTLKDAQGNDVTGIDASGRTSAAHVFSAEGVDLTAPTGSGTHQFRIDIGSQPAANATHKILAGTGAPINFVLPLAGDGKTDSSASGSSGGIIDVALQYGSSQSTVKVKASSLADIVSRGDVIVNATTIAQSTSSGTNRSGGLAAYGETESRTAGNYTTIAELGGKVRADGDVKVNASSDVQGTSSANTRGGAGIPIYQARSGTSITYSTRAEIAQNADVEALGDIRIGATSRGTNIVSDADVATGGAGGDAFANRSNLPFSDGSPSGVGTFVTADTNVAVAAGAKLAGRFVEMAARVQELRAESRANAEIYAALVDAKSSAPLDVDSDSRVDVGSGAVIRGDGGVDLFATHGTVNTLTYAKTIAGGLPNIFVLFLGRVPVAEARADSTTDVRSDIVGASGATFYAAAGPDRDGFALRAVSDNESISRRRNADARGLFTSRPGSAGGESPERVSWNADVVIGSGLNPTLIIDEHGTITTLQNINVYGSTNGTATNAGNPYAEGATINADEIIVDDIAPSGRGKLLFDGGTSVSGDQGTFSFSVSLGAVNIENASNKDLVIRNITTYAAGSAATDPEVYINGASKSLLFDIESVAAGTNVSIANLSASTLEFEGTIDNPIGVTTILNTAGDIISRTDRGESKSTRAVGTIKAREALIRTHELTIDADDGSIGSLGERLNIDLVEYAGTGGDAYVHVHAGDSLYLDLLGIQRVASPSDFAIAVDEISAGYDADLLLQSGVRQAPQSILGVGVDALIRGGGDTPNFTPPRAMYSYDGTYYAHYKPEAGGVTGRPTIGPTGLSGGPSTDTAMTYVFAGQDDSGAELAPRQPGLSAGHNITVVQAGDLTDVAKHADKYISIDAELDLVDAGEQLGGITIAVTGPVTAIEHTGNMRLSLVRSAAGDVTLTANDGSIIENESDVSADPDPDVIGRNVTLTALFGGIGSGVDHFLEINSAKTDATGASTTGDAITATAQSSIWLYETEGPAQVGAIVSNQEDVALGAEGDIVDVGDPTNDDPADVVGVNIDLFSVAGSIGTASNAFEVNSSYQTIDSSDGSGDREVDGRLNAYAKGSIFLTETVKQDLNRLNVFFIEAVDGKVVLTLPETADATDTTEDFLLIGADNGTFDRATRFGEIGVIAAASAPSRTPAKGHLAAGTTIDVYVADDITTEAETETLAGDAIRFFGDHGDADMNYGTNMLIQGLFASGRTTDPFTQKTYFFGNGDADTFHFVGTTFESNAAAYGSASMAAPADKSVDDGRDIFLVDQLGDTKGLFGGQVEHYALRLDGQADADVYIVNTAGSGATGTLRGDYVINVLDGGAPDDGSDTLDINGEDSNDIFLLRAMKAVDGETGLVDPAFVALLYGTLEQAKSEDPARPQEVARINYDMNIDGRLTVAGGAGNDYFAVDDTSAIITLDGGDGDDEFQIGQLYGSKRANGEVAPNDEFETLTVLLDSDAPGGPVTGELSRGNSLPLLVQGGAGNDKFTVYSNQAELRLEGDDGNDEFLVRAFVLDQSTVSTGAKTDIFGGNDDDLIQYNINAPVSIDGGAGFDKVVVIGTEQNDAFVITEDGVFGAGLNVRLSGNEELTEIDGLEGDDDFFVLSTPAGGHTRIIGGTGNDTINVTSDVTERIESRELEGLSGVINHAVASTDPAYDAMLAGGIMPLIASAAEGLVVIEPTGGSTDVEEGGATDSFRVYLAEAPTAPVYVYISAARSTKSEQAQGGDTVLISTDPNVFSDILKRNGADENVDRRDVILVLDASNVGAGNAKTVYVKAVDDGLVEGERTVAISTSTRSADSDFHRVDVANIEVKVRDNDKAEAIIVESDNTTRVLEGSNGTEVSDTFTVKLGKPPASGETVTMTLTAPTGLLLTAPGGGIPQSQISLSFTDANWDQLQTITVTAIDDATREDTAVSSISVKLTTDAAGPSDYKDLPEQTLDVVVYDNDTAGLYVVESDGRTLVTKPTLDANGVAQGVGTTDTYTMRLTKEPVGEAGQPGVATISLLGDGQTYIQSAMAGGQERLILADVGATESLTFTVSTSADGASVLTLGGNQSWIEHGYREGDLVRIGSDVYKISRIASDGTAAMLTNGAYNATTGALLAAGAVAPTSGTADVTRVAQAISFDQTNFADEVTITVAADPYFDKRPEDKYKKEFPTEPHLVSKLRGPLEVIGDSGPARTLAAAVILPGEHNVAPDVVSGGPGLDETKYIDTLNIFDDSSQQDQHALLTDTNLSGLGMSDRDLDFRQYGTVGNEPLFYRAGITFGDSATGISTVEVFNLLLGQGNDTVDVTGTLHTNADHGGITTLHGGGNTMLDTGVMGGDTFNVTGTAATTAGPDSPLVIYGDTSQDGKWYSGTPGRPSSDVFGEIGERGEKGYTQFKYPVASPFDHFGNDVINAADLYNTGPIPSVGITVYGGEGDDKIYGSWAGDHIAGGSGNDEIYGNGGSDHIYGDSGFNVDVVTHTLHVVNKDASTFINRDPLTVGADIIDGGEGNDYILGDYGYVVQSVPDSEKIYTTLPDTVIEIENATALGERGLEPGNYDGRDIIEGGEDDDVIIAGIGNGVDGDEIYGDYRGGSVRDGDDVIIGDFGTVRLGPGGDHRKGSAFTAATPYGDQDRIFGNGGHDWIFGAGASDTIHGDDGNDIIIGDHGRIVGEDGSADALTITSTDPDLGAGDTIYGDDGRDEIVAGTGRDWVSGGLDDDLIFGDHAFIRFLDPRDVEFPYRPIYAEAIFEASGDDDAINGDDGEDLIFGGAGNDVVHGGTGSDRILGDVGYAIYDPRKGVLTERLAFISTTESSVGGDDYLYGDESCDYVIGALGDDHVEGNDGDDIVAGDSAYVRFYVPFGKQQADFQSIDIFRGGYDVVDGGPGNDVLVAGQGKDLLVGNNHEDLLFGDNIAFQVRSALPCELDRAITRIEYWGPPPTEIVTEDSTQGGTGINAYGGGPFDEKQRLKPTELMTALYSAQRPIILGTWRYLDPLDGATGDFFDRFERGLASGRQDVFHRDFILPLIDGSFRSTMAPLGAEGIERDAGAAPVYVAAAVPAELEPLDQGPMLDEPLHHQHQDGPLHHADVVGAGLHEFGPVNADGGAEGAGDDTDADRSLAGGLWALFGLGGRKQRRERWRYDANNGQIKRLD